MIIAVASEALPLHRLCRALSLQESELTTKVLLGKER
jgi:hypothetical protein